MNIIFKSFKFHDSPVFFIIIFLFMVKKSSVNDISHLI